MSEKKSILAETLEEIQTAKQQIEENASFMLSSTLKEELGEIIKNGLAESNTEDIADDDTSVDPTAANDAPATDDVPPAPQAPTETTPTDGLADTGAQGEEVIDLTGATPDEVIGSFKLMAPTDEIEIVKTETGIEFKIAGEQSPETAETPGAETAEVNPEDLQENEVPAEEAVGETKEEGKVEESAEPVFEIEITEDDDENVEDAVDEAMSHHMGMKRRNIAHNENDPNRVEESDETTEETVTEEAPVAEEVNESKGKLVAARKKVTQLTLENKKLQKELAQISESVEAFKTSEAQYQQANDQLRAQLQEIAVFTSNLTYAVKLMTENTTTKEEKIEIIKRLDSSKTIAESKETYMTLSESFKTGKSASAETIIENKILGGEKSTSSSKINESVAYVDPTVARIKEIIGKMKY